ncbi:hypothetical protein MMC21_004718 [Puttea exsequens]|nr:hypothetical protein [Puttea exsequens]
MGHDDWIYSISWQPSSDRLALLSASADNSLAIWQSEESSGVWYSTTRLGEISTQKGSTTATGSTGGFWVGLWSPNGDSLVSLGRTGSWRMWDHDKGNGRWIQRLAISGHTKSVNDVVWSKDGSYLLSTSSDQTTRLHATWRHGLDQSWHEMARPQIHGYDINCIASVSQSQFVSGADEKLLRVFDEPRDTAELLAKLSKIEPLTQNELPGSATIPVLGLSNKSMDYDPNNESDTDSHTLNEAGREQQEAGDGEKAHLQVPPFENRLGRHTLWPESEKLYGHGYEISAVAASHDGSLLATACKASALDHAVIRLYTTKDWRELKPALKAHSSTIHALSFSEDDSYLLSVGRDRQWAVFERDGLQEENYFLKSANLHAHKRQILATSWIPIEAGRIFVTASRDMSVKLWQIKAVAVECFMIIKTSSAAAAIDVAPILVNGDVLISVGLETGIVKLFLLDPHSWAVKSSHALDDT